MKTLTHTITAAMLICGGIFAGHFMFSQSGGSDSMGEIKNVSPRAVRFSSPSPVTIKKSENKRDLTFLIAHSEDSNSSLSDLDRMLERMSVSELKQLARDQFRALVELDGGEMIESNRILHSSAITYLFRRVGAEALDWASDLENPFEREMMLDQLFVIAPREDVSVLIAWMKSNETKSSMWSTNGIYLSEIVRNAAKVNVDDVILAFSLFKRTNLINTLFGAEFAQDFDFVKLHQALGEKDDLSSTYGPWAARDRDGAWAFLKDHLENPAEFSSDNGIRAFLSAVVEQDGEKEGVKWLMERVIKLSPENISEHIIGNISRTRLSAEGFSIIGESLDASVRPDLAALLVRDRGVNSLTYGVLDRLSRQELMTVVKLNLPSQNKHRFVSEANMRPDRIISDLTERYQLTPEEIANADEEAASQKKKQPKSFKLIR